MSGRSPTAPAVALHTHQLEALVRISAAVAAAHGFEEVLEIAGESSCAVLGFASLAISRFDAAQAVTRTLFVTGEIVPPEARWPKEEEYPLADFPSTQRMITAREPVVGYVDDPAMAASEAAFLRSIQTESAGSVPIEYGGEVWGELYVTTKLGAPRIVAGDVTFLQAVCAQVSVALGRAELFSRITRAAYEDALTGLANRRAFEDGLEAAFDAARASGEALTLVLGDLDGLKQLNDGAGHAAGDAALAAVGRVLESARGPGALAARIGGDEFALLLPGSDAADGERLVGAIAAALAAGEPAVSVSWGVASLSPRLEGPRDLLRYADQAQYGAKRSGGRRGAARAAEAPRVASLPADAEYTLVDACLEALDALPHAGREQRLVRVVRELADRVDARRWVLLRRDPGSDVVRELAALDRAPWPGHHPGPEVERHAALLPSLLAEPKALVVDLGRGACVCASTVAAGGADALLLYAAEGERPRRELAQIARLLLTAA